ncbi:MAG: hypothetical protein ACUVR3_13390, partial [Candidatus Roseilinea sp.]|uniref:hypothetical protein n=1 Tax=Candidatus Roseilinea sp. TaxID=2838777 RepID=UPI0040495394
MSRFEQYPEKLREVLEIFAENPADRNAMLIDYSDQFEGVPESIARRPYPKENHVPHFESESNVFVEALDGNSLKFHIYVENPF